MLHALVDYARQEGISSEAGFTPKIVRWLINFTPDGQYLGVASTLATKGKRKTWRTLTKAPHLKFSGDTPMRQFLIDTAQYALLFGEGAPNAKLLLKHDYFLRLLSEASEAEPFLGKVAVVLRDDTIRQRICRDLEQQTPKAKPSDNVTFVVITNDGAMIIAEENTWHDWWRSYFPTLFKQKKKPNQPMRCFVSGKMTEPYLTHPKIKGLGDVGGNVETTLVGFNLDAFCSYGLEQSRNAAISEEMAEQYAATLNKLLNENAKRLVNAKVVYWYVGDVPDDDDPMPLLFGDAFGAAEVGSEKEGTKKKTSSRARLQAETKVAELLDAIRNGKRPYLQDARYCALTLSGNSGRVVVRDWMEGQFEELLINIQAWFDDLAIVSRDGSSIVKSHKLTSILAAPVREIRDVPAPLAASIWYAAIKQKPISHQMMAQTLARIKVDLIQDEPARPARFGILKAYSIRNERMPKMTEELNYDLQEPAYLCGRIMAILASMQQVALGDVGAGIVQRYYAAASATPGLVLGRLVRLAQIGHLPKIESKGLRNWFDNQLAEAWQKLKQAPPATLTLEEQTLFAMGYYQQKAKRSENKKSSNTAEESVN